MFRIAKLGQFGKVAQHGGQRNPIIRNITQTDAIQLGHDGLTARPGVNQRVGGVRIWHVRQGDLGSGQHPLLFHLRHAFLGVRRMLDGFAGELGLLNQVQIIIGRRVVRIKCRCLFQFALGIVQLAHLVKHLPVLHQRLGICFLRLDLRLLFHHGGARSLAFRRGEHLIVLFFESQRGGIFGIRLQNLLRLRGRLVQIITTLRGARQRQPGAGQTVDGLIVFGVNAGTDLRNQFARFLIELGGGHRVARLGHAVCLGQFLAEHDGVGLAQHSFVDRDGGGIVLGRHGGGQGDQGGEAEEKEGGFCHGSMRFFKVARFNTRFLTVRAQMAKMFFSDSTGRTGSTRSD